MNFKSNDEITEMDIDQMHYYTISLYDEITSGGYDDLDKTRIKNRIRHLYEIVTKG